jgi:hypothetical protein
MEPLPGYRVADNKVDLTPIFLEPSGGTVVRATI